MTSKKSNGSSSVGAGVFSEKGPEAGYFVESRGLALSFLLIAPLLLAYEFALIHYPQASVHDAGYVLKQMLGTIFHTTGGLVVNIIVVILLVAAAVALARRGRLHLSWAFPMIVESIGWAGVLAGLGACLGFRLPSADGRTMENIVNSIGAGIYEEIIFRFFLTGGLFLLGLKLFNRKTVDAVIFAAVLSSVAFALCHFLFTPKYHQEMLRYGLFFFVCGLLFSGLYLWRGLGVVVYTHVIYNIFVRLAHF